MLQIILVSARHLTRIVNEILKCSKMEFSQLRFEENKIEMRVSAQDLPKMFATTLL
jgi:hypothetical protein